MEQDFKNRGDVCPQLLDLIPNERGWMMVQDAGGGRGDRGLDVSEEEKKLELRLGLPGGGEEESSVLSLGFFSKVSKTTTTTPNKNSSKSNPCAGAIRGLFEAAESTKGSQKQQQEQEQEAGFLQMQSRGDSRKARPHETIWAAGKVDQHQSLEIEEAHAATPGNAAGPNTTSQTRTTPIPVVGWPPVRSFRKNLASSSVKLSVESENGNIETKVKLENGKMGLLVKINMEGIPIGRKVDLNSYDSYQKLSLAVEELFLGLLAAQKDTSTSAPQENEEAKQAFTGLLDGSGEYTLVYEDTVGDRMLVGDVPWEMFVSMVKRLRVLKSSDLSELRLRAVCRKRTATECLS